MTPSVATVNASHPEPRFIEEAARRLCSGGLVAFPTETVYGLGADASNPKAIERLNQVKGRPPDKPYSIHVYDVAQLRDVVDTIPAMAQRLMDALWPGPLTIVMPATRGGTVGFRLPNHPVALAFLKQCGRAVVAPSANRSGSPPPTDGREVMEALQGHYDYLLDAGPTSLGRESTVVSVEGDRLRILREGAITASQLQAVATTITR